MCWNHWDYTKENQDFINFIERVSSLRHKSKMLRELTLVEDTFHLQDEKYEAHWFKTDGTTMDSTTWKDPNTDAITLTLGSEGKERRETWCFIFNQNTMSILSRFLSLLKVLNG